MENYWSVIMLALGVTGMGIGWVVTRRARAQLKQPIDIGEFHVFYAHSGKGGQGFKQGIVGIRNGQIAVYDTSKSEIARWPTAGTQAKYSQLARNKQWNIIAPDVSGNWVIVMTEYYAFMPDRLKHRSEEFYQALLAQGVQIMGYSNDTLKGGWKKEWRFTLLDMAITLQC